MSFSLEYVIAGLVIAAAVAYLGIQSLRKARTLAGKASCSTGCSCSESDHGHIGSD